MCLLRHSKGLFTTYFCNIFVHIFNIMKHISVIVPSGSSIVDTIIAPFNLLRMANRHFKKINGLPEEPFKIDLVGQSYEPVLYQGLFSIQPTATLKEIRKTDLIIISPISGDHLLGIVTNPSILSYTTMIAELGTILNLRKSIPVLSMVWILAKKPS